MKTPPPIPNPNAKQILSASVKPQTKDQIEAWTLRLSRTREARRGLIRAHAGLVVDALVFHAVMTGFSPTQKGRTDTTPLRPSNKPRRANPNPGAS